MQPQDPLVEVRSRTRGLLPRIAGAVGIWQSPRPWQIAIAGSLPLLAALSIFVSVTSPHLEHPGTVAIYKTYMTVASVLVGLLWWIRWPSNRIGPLLVLCGFLLCITSFKGIANPTVYNVGVAADAAFGIAHVYTILAFPSGHLRTVLDRWFMSFAAFGLLAIVSLLMLFSPTLDSPAALSECLPACPSNVFRIGFNPDLARTLRNVETYFVLTVAVGLAAIYCRRLWTATRPQRRMLLVVAVSTLLLIPAYSAFNFSARILNVDSNLVSAALEWAVVGTRVLFPLGFLIALLQAEVFAERALHRLLRDLANRPTLEEWRDMVADAVDDPSLRIAYRNRADESFREPDGTELLPPSLDAGKLWVPVESEGRPIAAIVADHVLTLNPELTRVAVSATRLAIENGQLEGELRASRTRLLDAIDRERRKIGRDLHDSAQQRLIALRIQLSLASEQLEPDRQPLLAQLGQELEQALEGLQAVARGAYPVVLTQYGVTAALRSASLAVSVPVSVRGDLLRRYSESVELAVYFCCLEALQNTAKHAGRGASAIVQLSEGEREVCFTVEDDGAGFDATTVERRSGLANVAERIAASGGTLSVESAPGGGTRVRGQIPV